MGLSLHAKSENARRNDSNLAEHLERRIKGGESDLENEQKVSEAFEGPASARREGCVKARKGSDSWRNHLQQVDGTYLLDCT